MGLSNPSGPLRAATATIKPKIKGKAFLKSTFQSFQRANKNPKAAATKTSGNATIWIAGSDQISQREPGRPNHLRSRSVVE